MIQQLLKMKYQLIPFLFLQINLINMAPLLLLPNSWMTVPSDQMLQKQLMELQALQQLNAQPAFQMANQLPLLVLLPNDQTNSNINLNQHLKLNTDHKATNTNNEEDDLNSIVIDAESEGSENDKQVTPSRAILLIPNGRLSIGDIISAIPFLPIEINVPDTIAWAYNGVASGIGSIITIIGRPFQGTQEAQTGDVGLQTVLKQIQMRRHGMRPLIMMPVEGPMLPIQV